MAANTKDLEILLGEPRRAIRSMAIAFIFAMAVVEINQFVDTFWVSGLGTNASSAVATVTPIYALMVAAGIGVGVGSTTTIAFRLGRSENEVANRLAGNSITLGIILSVAASAIVFLLAGPTIDLMGAGDIHDESMAYLMPYILMSPALLVSAILSSILRAEGAAKKSTVLQIAAAVFNMALDPLFIYIMGLGVFGAGLATSVSALLSIFIGFYWYATNKTIIKLDRAAMKFDKETVKEVLDVGAPKTIQTMISNMTDLIQRVFLIVAGGVNAVMFYNFTWRYIGLVNLPGRALDSAMVPVCSAAYGQSDLDKMNTAYKYTMKIVVGFGILAAAILFILAEPFIWVLTVEDSMAALRPEFIWTLRVSVFLIPFSALMGVGSSMLQALKKAKIPMNFYFIWGFVKLGMYAVAAYGFRSFEWIIYSMVLVHVFGGVMLIWLANREFRKAKQNIVSNIQ